MNIPHGAPLYQPCISACLVQSIIIPEYCFLSLMRISCRKALGLQWEAEMTWLLRLPLRLCIVSHQNHVYTSTYAAYIAEHINSKLLKWAITFKSDWYKFGTAGGEESARTCPAAMSS